MVGEYSIEGSRLRRSRNTSYSGVSVAPSCHLPALHMPLKKTAEMREVLKDKPVPNGRGTLFLGSQEEKLEQGSVKACTVYKR